MNRERKKYLTIGDPVEISGPKSVAHFGFLMPATIIDIKEFDGSLEIGGKPQADDRGRLLKAYILRFEDGTDYTAPYRRDEIRERFVTPQTMFWCALHRGWIQESIDARYVKRGDIRQNRETKGERAGDEYVLCVDCIAEETRPFA